MGGQRVVSRTVQSLAEWQATTAAGLEAITTCDISSERSSSRRELWRTVDAVFACLPAASVEWFDGCRRESTKDAVGLYRFLSRETSLSPKPPKVRNPDMLAWLARSPDQEKGATAANNLLRSHARQLASETLGRASALLTDSPPSALQLCPVSFRRSISLSPSLSLSLSLSLQCFTSLSRFATPLSLSCSSMHALWLKHLSQRFTPLNSPRSGASRAC